MVMTLIFRVWLVIRAADRNLTPFVAARDSSRPCGRSVLPAPKPTRARQTEAPFMIRPHTVLALSCGFRSKWSGDSTGSGPAFRLMWSRVLLGSGPEIGRAHV